MTSDEHGEQITKNMGTEKGMRPQKETTFSKKYDFGKFSSFPKNMFFVGSFVGTLIGFIAPEMVPWLSKKSEAQSGGPRTNLEVPGDEVSFQYFPKNMEIDFPYAM